MSYSTLPELIPEEIVMPLAKYYYDYLMKDLPENVKEEILGPAINPAHALMAEKFIDWLQPCGKYLKHENGYCILEDGTGYIATYMKIPAEVEPRKMFWYLKWLNIHSRSMVLGQGNLRYRIWNPADHADHYFVNWTDDSDGIYTTESLDLGEGEREYDTIRHLYNLRAYGLTDAKIAELEASGCPVTEIAHWESFEQPGAHLTLGQILPCPEGGYERRSVEWIGWRPSNGKLIREPRTKCDEACLRKVAYHTLIE